MAHNASSSCLDQKDHAAASPAPRGHAEKVSKLNFIWLRAMQQRHAEYCMKPHFVHSPEVFSDGNMQVGPPE
eukprot:2649258-Amphidinium_carterae.1